MPAGNYYFPLCIQLTLPDDFEKSTTWNALLALLQKNSFYGVELNIVNFEKIDPEKLKKQLGDYGLKMTYLATGAYAKKNQLSMSSSKEEIRTKTIKALDTMILFAEAMDCGVICGFIKGGNNEIQSMAAQQMHRSLIELKNVSRVPILIEATNHYESSLANTLDETFSLIDNFEDELIQGLRSFQILPDTYHMNIEEKSMVNAIALHARHYSNFHISDNNRYYPGFGALDFYQILQLLAGIDYQGTISIEGRNLYSMEEDIERCSKYLSNIAERIQNCK